MPGHYDPVLVALSFAIAILAAWVALEFSGRLSDELRPGRRHVWLVAGSVCMGAGIWSMHYVGMLAYRMDMPVLYDWPTVLASMLAAVAASGVAFLTITRRQMSWPRTVLGGLAMGGGITTMHFLGMAAMRMPEGITYSRPLVVLSALAAVVISMAALRLTFGLKGKNAGSGWKKVGAVLLMGAAIPVMHYVGMAAARWTGTPGRFRPEDLRHALVLSQLSAVMVVQVSMLVLAVALLFASWERRVSHFQSALHGSRRSFAQLLDHNERLQMAFRAGGVGIWECDPATAEFYVDPSLRDLYGLPHDGKPVPREAWKARVHPDDVTDLDQRWASCLAAGTTYENEYRIVRPDGSVKRVRSVASILRAEDGSLLRVLGMTWDVTAEREREQDTADLAERFRMTLESIGDAVISTDAQQRVFFMNRAASHLTGWSMEEAIQRPLLEVFVTRDEGTGRLSRSPVERCIESGETLLTEDGVLISRSGSSHNIRKQVALMNREHAAVLTIQDITSARRMEKELHYAATHDALTGLMNRAEFERQLRRIWEEARTSGRMHCLCMLDLDRFKIINDTSGHLAGDALLREIATLFRRNLQPGDLAARMGGDEFLVLLTDCTREHSERCVGDLLKDLSELRFPWEGRLYDVTASSGVVYLDRTSPEPEVLISQVDVATFTAKRNGRNQVSVYTGQDSGAAGDHQEMKIVAGLRRSLEENRFELYAQPIVPLIASKAAQSFELLLRMRDENGEMVSPAAFVPAAERYGLMGLVDRWVIRAAMQMHAQHCPPGESVRFAVNLSAESLSDPTLWPYVAQQLGESGISPAALTFEVTETGLIGNFDHARGFVRSARQVGCKIALDDFGTGLSSLSYLKQFALDAIKIDGGFIRTLQDNVLDQAIVRSIAEIARSMKAATVAECVEDTAMLELLGGLGVDHVQGWATGRPEPLRDVLLRLETADVSGAACNGTPARQFPEHAGQLRM